MTDRPFLSRRIEEAIGGRDQALAFEKNTGFERKTLQAWIDGKLPQMRLFLQFCQLVERSPAWFFEAGEPVANVCADPDDVVRIPYLDVVVSAGSGRINDVVRALDNLPWPRSMIAPMGNPREIQCMHCAGDSMEPGILDGALVFLRRTDDKLIKTSRRIPPIYVVLVGADARVKRVSSPTAKTRALISDNPTYPVEVLEMARVSILGPVVGWLNRPL